MEYRTVSLADQVYNRLEEDIISGKYERGEVLTEMKLSHELGVSRTPIREALRRLMQEHLVEETSKGMVVIGITLKDFEDMCTLRVHIEGLAARGFVENMTEASLKELKEALELQEFYLEKNDREHIRIMDSRFHEIIYENCGSTIYRYTLAPLHKKVQKYRTLSLERTGRAVKSIEEHRAIYNAIEAGDADQAEKLIIWHVKNAMSTIINKQREAME